MPIAANAITINTLTAPPWRLGSVNGCRILAFIIEPSSTPLRIGIALPWEAWHGSVIQRTLITLLSTPRISVINVR
jgi:hypothetical protein